MAAGREDRGGGGGGSPTELPGRWALATSGPVVRRAFGYLLVVGAILVAINHGDALWRGDVDGTRLVKILLTPLVPYAVSTLSSVSALRAAARREAAASPVRDGSEAGR